MVSLPYSYLWIVLNFWSHFKLLFSTQENKCVHRLTKWSGFGVFHISTDKGSNGKVIQLYIPYFVAVFFSLPIIVLVSTPRKIIIMKISSWKIQVEPFCCRLKSRIEAENVLGHRNQKRKKLFRFPCWKMFLLENYYFFFFTATRGLLL